MTIKRITILTLSLLLLLPAAWTQETNKEEKKAQKQTERRENFEAIMDLVEERAFVIEVDQYSDRRGETVFVNPTTNFVALRDSMAVLQLAFSNNRLGYNGLGGITLDGQVTELEIINQKPDKGLVSLRLHVFGDGFASADMFIDIYTDGQAVIRYSGQRGERFTMRGDFLSWGGANIFKGTSLF